LAGSPVSRGQVVGRDTGMVCIEEWKYFWHLTRMNQVHGHDVMEMMMTSGKTYTKETLVQDIIAKFGADARFHTCSAENMTAEQMVEFLDTRGKLVARDGGFQTSPDVMCQH
jgi:probable metal-binding protein